MATWETRLKQLDVDVFLYSTYSMHGGLISLVAIIIFWQVHDLLFSVVKLGGKSFQIQEKGIPV